MGKDHLGRDSRCRYENTAKVVMGELLSSQLLEPEAHAQRLGYVGQICVGESGGLGSWITGSTKL